MGLKPDCIYFLLFFLLIFYFIIPRKQAGTETPLIKAQVIYEL